MAHKGESIGILRAIGEALTRLGREKPQPQPPGAPPPVTNRPVDNMMGDMLGFTVGAGIAAGLAGPAVEGVVGIADGITNAIGTTADSTVGADIQTTGLDGADPQPVYDTAVTSMDQPAYGVDAVSPEYGGDMNAALAEFGGANIADTNMPVMADGMEAAHFAEVDLGTGMDPHGITTGTTGRGHYL